MDIQAVETVKKGDVISLKKQFMDEGDENYTFIAVDNSSKGRVTISHEVKGAINPTQVIRLDMIESINQQHAPTQATKATNTTKPASRSFLANPYHIDESSRITFEPVEEVRPGYWVFRRTKDNVKIYDRNSLSKSHKWRVYQEGRERHIGGTYKTKKEAVYLIETL